MKICTEWYFEENFRAVCPYCDTYWQHSGPHAEGDIVKCAGCKKEFKLGPEK